MTPSICSAPLPYLGGTLVNGGDPSGSDTVNLSGATNPVVVQLADSTLPPPADETTITGYGGTVTLTGVEVANLDANGRAMTVNGTTGADTIAVTPTSASERHGPGLHGRERPKTGKAGRWHRRRRSGRCSTPPTSAPRPAASPSTATAAAIYCSSRGRRTPTPSTSMTRPPAPTRSMVDGLLVVNYNAALPHVEIDCPGRQRHHQHRALDDHDLPGRRRRPDRRPAGRYHQPDPPGARTRSIRDRPLIPAA